MDLSPASKDGSSSTETTTPKMTTTTTTTTEAPTRNPFLPTEESVKDHLAETKSDADIILPPVNPYLPTDKEKESLDEIAKLEAKQESYGVLVPPPNPYLPGAVNDTNEEKGLTAHIPTTPMLHTRPHEKP